MDDQILENFSIAFLSQNIDLSVRIKLKLNQFQYEYLSDAESLIKKLNQAPSHIVILDMDAIVMPLQQFIETALNISSEIKFIFLVNVNQFLNFENYRKYNLVAVLDKKDPFVEIQLSQICLLQTEALYRFFQNEHLYELLENEKKLKADLQQILDSERASPSVRPYQIRIAQYKSCQSKEELLDIFYQQAGLQSWIYLKYIPSIETFIGVSHHEMPENWVEGLSYKIDSPSQNILSEIIEGQLSVDFQNYLLSKLKINQIKFLPLIIKGQIEGLMISSQDITAESAEDFSLMTLVYTQLTYESQPKYLDVEDSLTGFYNHLFYKRVLEKEYQRAKRSAMPLSVIKIAIDKFSEMESLQGQVVVDDIIKKTAYCIEQSSRVTDYVCRTDANEFSVILVNCSRKGAAIRADRLKEVLYKENYSKFNFRLTISQGISEYPTTAENDLSLNETALQALQFIADKGGDRLCLAKAKQQHVPDFIVHENES